MLIYLQLVPHTTVVWVALLWLGRCNQLMAGTVTAPTPQDIVVWGQWTSNHLANSSQSPREEVPEKQCPAGAVLSQWLAEPGVLRLLYLSPRDAIALTSTLTFGISQEINLHLPTGETSVIIPPLLAGFSFLLTLVTPYTYFLIPSVSESLSWSLLLGEPT